jgi:transcription elongation factor GreB
VGVDEADVKQGKIAFISPIARMLMYKKIDETVTLKLANGETKFKVISIE